MVVCKVATCNLNQFALDFDGNVVRIKQSVEEARAAGARLRLGPELEIPGYGCEDHFLEEDTSMHSWEALAELFRSGCTDDLLCDFGMPVMFQSVRYNCRVLCLNRKILLIRPKLFLANDGNYRETRWFTRWQYGFVLKECQLPVEFQAEAGGQSSAPIGPGMLQLRDTIVAPETCEELFTPNSPHIALALSGAEIITNGSGSHHNLRKLDTRLKLILSAIGKSGGCYMYANQIGCDGGRLYYDGCAMIGVNGSIVAQGAQFSMKEVEVVTATVDLVAIRSQRAAFSSRCEQSATTATVPSVRVDYALSEGVGGALLPTHSTEIRIHHPMEEIALGPACWLWDYLRRSGQGGFFVALSGGADSASVAAIVGSMCQLLAKEVAAGNETVLRDLRFVTGVPDYTPKSAEEIANRLLYTCYMGTTNSSQDTRSRAKQLAGEIGAYHLDASIDIVIEALTKLFVMVVGKTPRFRAHGSTDARENLALQNIQARLRMVFGYMLAQLLPWSRDNRGSLLVLGTANVDEALRGYYTKYDCSAADLNPIGSVCKEDLKRFMGWAAEHLGYPEMANVLKAPPTAELEPITEDYTQLDEVDMGMSYAELQQYGQLRKQHRAGPVSMFRSLATLWGPESERGLSMKEVADKVKKFFFFYSINRHKMTTLTPSYHAEDYSPEDNRHDLRQFLYNVSWKWQFRALDSLQERYDSEAKKRSEGGRPTAAPPRA
mmetsp:Transcript_39470/g.97086  ORF Transcript_39470/g.97086 Transcript_39470/m.97086 type:complete len:719 (+) Transcript_39470:93-2249(+)|eukprot:CAMPEP_0206232724 /NCGR_PEP_ID=MMETSP0047_2-20121206/11575_1 /ASSEMBLY_ACC=CAM_ASM_000192 /TAXON_ID=195065 /ORGANISM="Chroomonas mesostigmatica_cf, Strain CCMP1168" /LENGTH=718 /DNA_ID=CAMNT_0053656493 /DNA_START=85 /DNA_END=2241 /DNA_ORIENTATION=+